MSEVLIIYSSTNGQTKLICEKIKNSSNKRDLIKIVPLDEAKMLNLSLYKLIIIGASIRYGNHKRDVFNLIKKNKKILEYKKSAFFSVNVVARKIEKSTPETNPYVKKFLKRTNWKPDKVAVFAGKIEYPIYNFLDRIIIRLIMMITKGPTDTSKSYEFTDWSKVNDFSREIDQLLG